MYYIFYKDNIRQIVMEYRKRTREHFLLNVSLILAPVTDGRISGIINTHLS